MLIHPWDAVPEGAWCDLVGDAPFGELVVGTGEWPVVVPLHFVLRDGVVLTHLARPNPVWAAIEANPRVVLSLVSDWTYVEAAWNAEPGSDPAYGVPTSYYTAVQLRCLAEIVDDPVEKAEILAVQLAAFEPPDSTRVTPSPDIESDRRQLPGIRGLRLHVQDVLAKQKYGGNRSPEHRRAIADRLTGRGGPGDAGSVRQMRLS